MAAFHQSADKPYGKLPVVTGRPAVGASVAPDDALSVLRDLVAGADDHRCWYIPDEIAGRIRALVAEHPTNEGRT